jgi:hypothetical protein
MSCWTCEDEEDKREDEFRCCSPWCWRDEEDNKREDELRLDL